MKKMSKNILLGMASVVAFAAYFVLSLSCATTTGVKRDAGEEVSVWINETENKISDYDITLVSGENCPSRILKIVDKRGGIVPTMLKRQRFFMRFPLSMTQKFCRL